MVYPVGFLHCRLQYVPNILPGRVGRGEGRRKEKGGGREGGGTRIKGGEREGKRRKRVSTGISFLKNTHCSMVLPIHQMLKVLDL